MASNMAITFKKEEVSLLREPYLWIDIECPLCLEIMTKGPHLVSCCGRHFCGPCIARIQENKEACPECKRESFQAIIDKSRLSFIESLTVSCCNKSKGCMWKGRLCDLSEHLKRGERKGECMYEVVSCKYHNDRALAIMKWICCQVESKECQKQGERYTMKEHEAEECICRPYSCQYCNMEGKFWEITTVHCNKCPNYPIKCPNMCNDIVYTNETVKTHLSEECLLQSVSCEYYWAGCTERPLRKDLHRHLSNEREEHLMLVTRAYCNLKTQNEELKTEFRKAKKVMKKRFSSTLPY